VVENGVTEWWSDGKTWTTFGLVYERGDGLTVPGGTGAGGKYWASKPAVDIMEKQAMVQAMKDVIPVPAWMRKIMDASLKERGITSAEARRQTQNALKGRTEKQPAKSDYSTNGRFKKAA